jgi:hypothetical protein
MDRQRALMQAARAQRGAVIQGAPWQRTKRAIFFRFPLSTKALRTMMPLIFAVALVLVCCVQQGDSAGGMVKKHRGMDDELSMWGCSFIF